MSTLLSQIKTGKVKKPELILIYGPDKVGKSTFGSQAPKPIFLGTEDGTANLDVPRFPAPQSFDDICQAIKELTNEQHEFQTLVVDTLDWMEPFIYEKVCRDGGKERIEDFGYGTGYKNSLVEWRKVIRALETLQLKRRMNVILIAHSEIKTFNDPQTNAAYDRYQLKLYDRASALFREFVDVILFANHETHTTKEKGDQKWKAFGDGKSKVYTERRPAFDAGNRYDLPFEIDLGWKAYQKARDSMLGETAEELRKSVVGLLENVKDTEILAKAKASIEKAGLDCDQLRSIKRRLMELTAA